MIELLVLMVAGLLLIALCAVIGPRIDVASPLLLVLAGVAASFLPIFTDVGIEPELILAGLLPPLLYSAASSMPAMNFRREFGTISGLSVLLVVGTALVLGAFFQLVIPDLGFAWGVALGAIISPTDAVATSIVKQNPASKRVAAILDGEGLLNDATALVVLRTAIVATAASFSFWSAVGSFAFSVVVATLIGLIAGIVNLAVRRRIDDPTASAAISLSIPFLASIPAEALGASGLVAAVVAGLLTGIRAPRDLSPHIRLPDAQNWRTVELVLEGIIFLTMGLQIRTIVLDVHEEHGGLGTAVLIAVGALALTVLIRAAFVAPLLVLLKRKRQRLQRMQPRLSDLQETLSTEEGRQQTSQRFTRPRGREISERQMDRFVTRVTRGLADIDYFLTAPLGAREGTAIVWAGMRGAVTVAAAQTLPLDAPQRSVLVLIAFTAALLSLVVQGGTLGPVLRALRTAPAAEDPEGSEEGRRDPEQVRLREMLREVSESVEELSIPLDADERTQRRMRADRFKAVLEAQRAALLDARDDGLFDADLLEEALVDVDASQIAIELRDRPRG